MSSAGAVPPEPTVMRLPAWWVRRAAATCDRPALWMRTNNTSGAGVEWGSAIGGFQRCGVEETDECVGEQCADELHEDEHRRGGGFDAGEAVGEGASDGDGRVGEAGR